MTPGVLNLYVRAGDTLSQTLTLSSPGSTPSTPGTPINLTGCSAEMNIVTATGVTYYLNSTTATANGGILTLGGTAGTIVIYIPDTDTITLVAGQYDLRVQFANGYRSTIVAGQVFVTPEVAPWV